MPGCSREARHKPQPQSLLRPSFSPPGPYSTLNPKQYPVPAPHPGPSLASLRRVQKAVPDRRRHHSALRRQSMASLHRLHDRPLDGLPSALRRSRTAGSPYSRSGFTGSWPIRLPFVLRIEPVEPELHQDPALPARGRPLSALPPLSLGGPFGRHIRRRMGMEDGA